MKDQERDILRKTILELVKKGHVHYTDIEKKAVATCLRFATSNTVRKQFYHYLGDTAFFLHTTKLRVKYQFDVLVL